MVGERLNQNNNEAVREHSEVAREQVPQPQDSRESGKKILEATMIPEGMTIEQYEAYLDGQIDRFGNPVYSTSTKQNLLEKFSQGELSPEDVNPEARSEAENAERAQAEVASEKQNKIEGILAGRTPGEALTGIETELKELDWAKWNLEQFLAAHVDTVSPEEAETYHRQLELIAGRTTELNDNKALIEGELGTGETSLPEMGERATLDLSGPIERDSSKLVTAMGRMLEKWRTRRAGNEPELLSTEPGAKPSAEEFTEAKAAQELPENKEVPEDKETQEVKESHETKEALVRRLAEKLKYRAPMKGLVARSLLTLMAVTMLSGVPKLSADADSAQGSRGRQKRVEAEGRDEDMDVEDVLRKTGLHVVDVTQEMLDLLKAAETNANVNDDEVYGLGEEDVAEVEQSFENQMLNRGAELYEGFMDREGSEVNDLGVVGNYTEGWDLNKPGSNHFGPDLSEIIKQAVEDGHSPEDVLPEVTQRIFNIYRDQPECLMAYMASFPNLMEKIGVSSEISNIEDITERTNALVDLLYSEQGGGDLQKKMLAAAELTMFSEDADVEITQLYNYVETDYLKLKEGETESGLGHFDVKSQGKQRKGEWHVIFTYEGESATVNTNCGGQKTYIVVIRHKETYSPTAVVAVASEEVTEAEVASFVAEQTGGEVITVATVDTGDTTNEVIPETPEVPDTPDTPEVPEIPETPETPEVPDDSKDAEDAKIVLNEEKVTDGTLTPTENVENVEAETTYEEVAPEEDGSEDVMDEAVGTVEQAYDQGVADGSEKTENIESDDEKLNAIKEFTQQLNEKGE